MRSVKKLILKALRQKAIPFRKKKVLIIVPDATKKAHLKEILPILIKKITFPGRTIDMAIANGSHKRYTPEQLQRLLGSPIVKRHKILQHEGASGYDLMISIDVAGPDLCADPATINRVDIGPAPVFFINIINDKDGQALKISCNIS